MGAQMPAHKREKTAPPVRKTTKNSRVAKKTKVRTAVFPLLKSHGKKLKEIIADGNCLFRACSYQFFGTQDLHRQVRQAAVQWMRDHPDDFQPKLDVEAGPTGEKRRSSRTHIPTSDSEHFKAATAEQTMSAWNKYLENLSTNYTWGDELCALAIACAYGVNIAIYKRHQTEFLFRQTCIYWGAKDGSDEPRASIAFEDTAVHYWTVVPADGSFTPLLRQHSTLPSPPSSSSSETVAESPASSNTMSPKPLGHLNKASSAQSPAPKATKKGVAPSKAKAAFSKEKQQSRIHNRLRRERSPTEIERKIKRYELELRERFGDTVVAIKAYGRL
ncbi:hypothetical protein B0O99DRAFT_598527 [Bisporella sp. PMI_857]|nr:hypothetical protein B0O99DRAFT_598527 [Bisporella sp. PMI_857]